MTLLLDGVAHAQDVFMYIMTMQQIQVDAVLLIGTDFAALHITCKLARV